MQRVKKDARMPPKAKFTRKTIDAAVLALVREKGSGALTSRELGTALWSLAACFVVFKSMHEVREAVRSAQRFIYIRKLSHIYPLSR